MATMITQWFPSTKKKYFPAVTGNVHHLNNEEYQAKNLNIGVQEFRRRREILEAACKRFDDMKWHLQKELYPATLDNYKQYGKVKVCGIARTLGQYGIVGWDDKFPRIIRVYTLQEPRGYLDCPIEWLSENEPVEQAQC